MRDFFLKLLKAIKTIQAETIFRIDEQCTACPHFDITTLSCRRGACDKLEVQYLQSVLKRLNELVDMIRRQLMFLNVDKDARNIIKSLVGL